MYIYVCLSGLWLDSLLHLSFLSKVVCYQGFMQDFLLGGGGSGGQKRFD